MVVHCNDQFGCAWIPDVRFLFFSSRLQAYSKAMHMSTNKLLPFSARPLIAFHISAVCPTLLCFHNVSAAFVIARASYLVCVTTSQVVLRAHAYCDNVVITADEALSKKLEQCKWNATHCIFLNLALTNTFREKRLVLAGIPICSALSRFVLRTRPHIYFSFQAASAEMAIFRAHSVDISYISSASLQVYAFKCAASGRQIVP